MNYLIWQLVDSGFPSGGFAHSAGLEASVHHGQVADAASLHAFARQAVAQAGRASLPLVTAAYRDTASIGELDRLCDVFLVNLVANRASRAQGRALLSSATRSFPQTGVRSLEQRVRREQLFGHHAPVFGAVLKLLGVELLETQRLFLFLTGRGVGSAAVRLGLIGAYDAQALQTLLGTDIDRVLSACGDLGPLEITQTAPLADLCQSTHDRLYTRLFQS